MKIKILSDLHIEFMPFSINSNNSDVIVLAGDIHTRERGVLWALENIKHKPVIYVLGNHEYYGKAYPNLIHKLKQIAQGTNVTILENDSILIKDVLFLGCTLWTDFELFGDSHTAGYQASLSMMDYKKIRVSPKYSKLKVIDTIIIHKKSLNYLKQNIIKYKTKKIVLVTHHAPSKKSIPFIYKDDLVSAAYASDLEKFIEQHNINLWIHGHIHESLDYNISSTRIICNPRGYPDELNYSFDPELVIEI